MIFLVRALGHANCNNVFSPAAGIGRVDAQLNPSKLRQARPRTQLEFYTNQIQGIAWACGHRKFYFACFVTTNCSCTSVLVCVRLAFLLFTRLAPIVVLCVTGQDRRGCVGQRGALHVLLCLLCVCARRCRHCEPCLTRVASYPFVALCLHACCA